MGIADKAAKYNGVRSMYIAHGSVVVPAPIVFNQRRKGTLRISNGRAFVYNNNG